MDSTIKCNTHQEEPLLELDNLSIFVDVC
jgi:hypothetical protein